jgi:hypothetical protein
MKDLAYTRLFLVKKSLNPVSFNLTFAARSSKNEIEALTKPTSRFYLVEQM